MKAKLLRLQRALFTDEPNIHVRNFNLLALAGIAVSALAGLSSLFTTNLTAALLCFALCAFAVGLLVFSARTKRYRLCYYVTILGIFLAGFSVIFFLGGGYLSGMPLFFIFAVVFTAFLLEGRELAAMLAVELAVYAADILLAWRFPQLVIWHESRENVMADMLICLLVVSVALAGSAYLQILSYRRQQKALERADQAKTVFLANISHELKTPLTVISNCAQTSKRHLGEEDGQAMDLICAEADRMALMVSQLLDVTAIAEGRMRLTRRPSQIRAVVKLAMDTYYPLAVRAGNRLVFRSVYDLPAVLADEDRIRQVVLNLLSNANRHTRDGEITVTLDAVPGCVRVTVRDTGEGIPAEGMAHLFERFAPKENRAGNDTGTGLGLYICKHIVESHGGAIAVQSTPGQGTAVRFTLPTENGAG